VIQVTLILKHPMTPLLQGFLPELVSRPTNASKEHQFTHDFKNERCVRFEGFSTGTQTSLLYPPLMIKSEVQMLLIMPSRLKFDCCHPGQWTHTQRARPHMWLFRSIWEMSCHVTISETWLRGEWIWQHYVHRSIRL